MKKIIQKIIVTTIVVLIAVNTNGQSRFSLGPKVVLSSTTLTGSDIDNLGMKVSAKVGFGAGIYLAISPVQWFTLQPEFLYSMKGASIGDAGSAVDYNINYFDVPILLKLKLPLGGTVYPFIMGGPDINFFLNSSFSTTDTSSGTIMIFQDSGNSLKKTDIGYIFGAGVDIQLGNFYLSGDLRYTKSMSSIYNKDQEQSQNTFNSSVGFGIGLGLIIGGK
jgi:hypothetical protein